MIIVNEYTMVFKDIVKLNIFSSEGKLQVLITKLLMDYMVGFVGKMNVWKHDLLTAYGVVS